MSRMLMIAEAPMIGAPGMSRMLMITEAPMIGACISQVFASSSKNAYLKSGIDRTCWKQTFLHKTWQTLFVASCKTSFLVVS